MRTSFQPLRGAGMDAFASPTALACDDVHDSPFRWWWWWWWCWWWLCGARGESACPLSRSHFLRAGDGATGNCRLPVALHGATSGGECRHGGLPWRARGIPRPGGRRAGFAFDPLLYRASLAGRSRTCDLRRPKPVGWPSPLQPDERRSSTPGGTRTRSFRVEGPTSSPFRPRGQESSGGRARTCLSRLTVARLTDSTTPER